MDRNGIISVTPLYAAKCAMHCTVILEIIQWKPETYRRWRKKTTRNDASLHVHKNALQCSCDKPFCCASSRCSPPQRRALPRRVAPFSDTRAEAPLLFFPLCFWYPAPYPRFQAVCLWCARQEPPPPPSILTTSLPSLSSSERLLLRASWSCSQKTLHANRRWRDVRRGGGNKGGGLFPCCFQVLTEKV